jgi:hypothetical protein
MLFAHVVALGLVVVALAAAGCGKSSTTTTTAGNAAATSASSGGEGSGQTTRAAFIAQADAICAGYNAKHVKMVLRTPRDYTTKLPILAASQQAEAVQLAKLTPPASMASDWNQIIAGSKAAASDISKVAGYASARSHKGVISMLTTATATQRQVLTLTSRDGFKDCSRLFG